MKRESPDLGRYLPSGSKTIFHEFFWPAKLKISSFEIFWIRLVRKSLFLSSNMNENRLKIASWVPQIGVPSQIRRGFVRIWMWCRSYVTWCATILEDASWIFCGWLERCEQAEFSRIVLTWILLKHKTDPSIMLILRLKHFVLKKCIFLEHFLNCFTITKINAGIAITCFSLNYLLLCILW